MSLLTLKALADLGIAGAQTLGNLQNIDERTRQALSDAEAARLAGQETYADLTEGNQFRVRQAPTGAADLTLSLAEQGLNRTRNRGSQALAGATANLGVDPRTGIAGVQRLLGQLGQMEGAAEQRAAEQSIGAQKIIDDSIYNQQEAERRRLEGLKTQFELIPAMQEYTRATGTAEALDQARRDTANQFISDALASTTNLIAGLDRNKSTSGNQTDAERKRLEELRRDFNDQQLQAQLAQPIPITDDGPVPIENVVIDPNQNIFGGGEVTLDPEEEIDENLNLEPITPPITFADFRTQDNVLMPGGPLAEAGPERGIVDISTAAQQPVNNIFPDEDFQPFNLDLRNQGGNPYLEGMDPAARATGGGGLTREDMPNLFPPQSIQPITPLQTRGPMQVPNVTSPNVIMINGVAIPTTAEEELIDFDKGGTYIGERGGMTSGEFNHDTNKKAIIDEESGKKEGELTGGEGVLNEDHLADIVKFIKEGDEDGLLAFLRNLLEEPQFGYDFA